MNIINYLKNPRQIFFLIGMRGGFKFLNDKNYLKLIYWSKFGERLDFENVITFNQKIQWLKLHNDKPVYSTMVDKYEAKIYVAEKIGDEYIIPTLGVWNNFDEIDFNKLPEKFVLKCTHDSGGLVVCKDKNTFDLKDAKKRINRSLKNNYYWAGRELPYKNVRPRIIAEQYMEDKVDNELRDYKFFTFNGKAEVMYIASDRCKSKDDTKFDFYNMNFEHLPFINGHPNNPTRPHKPRNFELMKSLAETLGEGFPYLRIDFYEVNGEVYFGELTFSHWSGFISFEPNEWDKKLGDLIKLPTPLSVNNK